MSKSRVIGIIVGILIGIGLFLAGFFVNDFLQQREYKNANKVGETFVSSIVSGNSQEAYNQLNSKNKSSTSQEDFTKQVSATSNAGAALSDASLFKGSNGYLFVQNVKNLPEKNGRTEASIYLAVTQEGNSWKVSNYAIYY
jgi:hypothetical protein